MQAIVARFPAASRPCLHAGPNFNFQPHFSLIEHFSVCKLIWVRAGERMLHRARCSDGEKIDGRDMEVGERFGGRGRARTDDGSNDSVLSWELELFRFRGGVLRGYDPEP